jgi:hypothetical protein
MNPANTRLFLEFIESFLDYLKENPGFIPFHEKKIHLFLSLPWMLFD